MNLVAVGARSRDARRDERSTLAKRSCLVADRNSADFDREFSRPYSPGAERGEQVGGSCAWSHVGGHGSPGCRGAEDLQAVVVKDTTEDSRAAGEQEDTEDSRAAGEQENT